MKYYIYADKFFFKEITREHGYLEIVDGKFGNYYEQKPNDAEIIDYSGYMVAPGLVDTHIHGYKNYDVMDADLEGLQIISREILSMGVTSYLPTTLTADVVTLNKVCELIGNNYKNIKGAKIRGIFLEGPFFTEKYKGAQNENYFMDPSIDIFDEWQRRANGLIKKIAIAPEREGAKEFIKYVTNKGVHVALGHSNATFMEAIEAIDAGANIFVHTYNAMSPLHHRDPGMVGAAMSSKESICELILDGYHVDPNAAKILVRIKTPNKVALVTDCMRAGGMPDGDYMLGDLPVIVSNNTARLVQGNNLAGSILKLSESVKNVIKWNIATLEEAIKMGSYIPAKSVCIEDKCGSITKGHDADFIILDKMLNLEKTYLDGELVFDRNR